MVGCCKRVHSWVHSSLVHSLQGTTAMSAYMLYEIGLGRIF